MIVDIKGDGYHFKGNKDCNDKMGVILDITTTINDAKQITELALVVDAEGNLIAPAYKSKSLGFVPLLNDFTTEADMNTFYRSNRSLYGVVGSFVMIVHGFITYRKDSEELIEEKLSFYIPKNIVNEQEVVCDKVDVSKGINTMVVNANILNAYKNRVLDSLNSKNMNGKLNYISSLVK